jgi:hypothetical protein
VIYRLSFPGSIVEPAPVTLPGGVVIDTISTGTSGLDQSITVLRTGAPYLDTAFVTVRSYRASGADVPGSGQRFIVLFQ